MYCLKCEKNKVHPRTSKGQKLATNLEEELDILYHVEKVEEEGFTTKTRTVANGMTDDGDVSIISMGYGSNFDGDMYIIGICDDCIKSLRDSGLILFCGDYMFDHMSGERIDESKKLYIRRRNLDDLIDGN
jgi:hypothetical protein